MIRFACLIALGVLAPLAVAQPALPTLRALVSPNPDAGGAFGTAVARVPDLDGDGRDDLLIGAPEESSLLTTRLGRAYAFSSATGLPLDTLISRNTEAEGLFGRAVAGLPDGNLDGRGEYAVGAPGESALGMGSMGRVYLMTGITELPIATVVSAHPVAGGLFGWSLAMVPDATGDGRDDLLVGAPGETVSGTALAGRVYLVDGLTGARVREMVSPTPSANGQFGWAVAGVPDVDGDGRGDLLVGAPAEAGNRGQMHLFSGVSGALIRTITPAFTGAGAPRFGASVAAVPDLTGDGRADLAAGAPGFDADGTNAGRAYIYASANGALVRTLLSGAPPESAFGAAMAGVPDLNGDGAGDLAVAAVAGGTGASGTVTVVSGDGGSALARSDGGGEFSGRFGAAIAALGDVDGDGRTDLLVGAPSQDGGGVQNGGRAYLLGTGVVVAGEDAPVASDALALAVAPSPAAGAVTLAVRLAQPATVRLVVLDALGREVAALAHALPAGTSTVPFDAGRLAPGVYLVRLVAAGTTATARLIVAR